MQKQKSKSRTEEVDEAVESQTERSKEISDEAACCLAEIDSLLEECANRPPTDEEIMAKGLPDWDELDPYEDALWNKHEEKREGKITNEEYENSPEFRAFAAKQEELHEQYYTFIAAYERVTGMKYDACTC